MSSRFWSLIATTPCRIENPSKEGKRKFDSASWSHTCPAVSMKCLFRTWSKVPVATWLNKSFSVGSNTGQQGSRGQSLLLSSPFIRPDSVTNGAREHKLPHRKVVVQFEMFEWITHSNGGITAQSVVALAKAKLFDILPGEVTIWRGGNPLTSHRQDGLQNERFPLQIVDLPYWKPPFIGVLRLLRWQVTCFKASEIVNNFTILLLSTMKYVVYLGNRLLERSSRLNETIWNSHSLLVSRSCKPEAFLFVLQRAKRTATLIARIMLQASFVLRALRRKRGSLIADETQNCLRP